MSLSTSQQNAMQLALHITGSLSILGSSSIIVAFARVKRLQTPMNWQVVYMSIADLIMSMVTIFGNSFTPEGTLSNNFLCASQGFFITFGGLSSALWNASMATHLLISIYKTSPIANLNHLFKWYHLVSWGVPLLASLVPIIWGYTNQARSYYDATLWCWITDPLLRMVDFYNFLWAAFLYTIIAYSLILIRLSKHGKAMVGVNSNSGITSLASFQSQDMGNKGEAKKKLQPSTISTAERRLILKTSIYAMVFIICWVPATINRLLGLVGINTPFELNLLHTIVVPFQGFLNAINFFVFVRMSRQLVDSV